MLLAGLGVCPVLAEEAPAIPYHPLPPAPEGVALRQVVGFNRDESEPVRVAGHPKTPHLFLLCADGDLWRVDPVANTKQRVLIGKQYIQEPPRKEVHIKLFVDPALVNAPVRLRATLCLGLHLDTEGTAYVVANVLYEEKIHRNHVVIYRITDSDGDFIPDRAQEFAAFDHPYGVGGFNHGAGHLSMGPDGWFYLGVGSRTDHGETGADDYLSKAGETEYTACILRFDPRREKPQPEVFARGLRNPFGFAWDERGRLLEADHDPTADHPAELNLVEQGKHYGFPYRFGRDETPDYPDALPLPQGLAPVSPLANLGPDGRLGDHVTYSLAPHSAPGGMTFYRAGLLPKRYDNSFFLTRFGNLMGKNRIGFDVLRIRLEEEKGTMVARTELFLGPLARPIDICTHQGKLYILEYCRQLEAMGTGARGFLQPGRLLEAGGP